MQTDIIQFLRNQEGFVSGEALSNALGVSRAAIWKHMEELRSEGYMISAESRKGYKLKSIPDKLFPLEIQNQLETKRFAKDVHYFDVLDSTMSEAFRLGMDGVKEGCLVVAESQTKGRGRMGRIWKSPKGKGLYFSLVLRPSCSMMDVARLTLVAAVAVSQAIEDCCGVRVLIKWPNDLFVDGKKLVGILTEMRAELDRINFVIMGIGINVNTLLKELPPEGISLKEASGKTILRVALLKEILCSLEKWYDVFLTQGFSLVRAEWKERCLMMGREVTFQERGEVIRAKAFDLAEDGGLMLRLSSGEVVKKMAGDVTLTSTEY